MPHRHLGDWCELALVDSKSMSRWTTGDDEADNKYADQLEAGEIHLDYVSQDGVTHGHVIDPETGAEVKVYLKDEYSEPTDDEDADG